MTLTEAGYRVDTIAVRPASKHKRRATALARRVGAGLVQFGKDHLSADIVWITVPDDAIASVANALARSGAWQGKIVFHSSGALTSDELAPLRAKGARVASVHPMMTFVRDDVPQMAGVAFALEGDAAAVRVAKAVVEDLGGNAFTIKKENKVLYHVFGSFASPLVIALMATMEEVALAAGIRKRDIKRVMEPLIRQTLRNYLTRDAASALSGPLVRGDVATIRKHIAELQRLHTPRQIYLALARAAVNHLPAGTRHIIADELAGAEE